MLRPARVSSSAALALLLFAALPALAEPASPAPEPPSSPQPPDSADAAAAGSSQASASARAASSPAHELFLEAERRYEAGDYEGALRSLRESYELAAPELRIGLLFSLAQAYRQLGRCVEARDLYAEYLTSSQAKSPAVAQRRDDARYHLEQLNAQCPASALPERPPSTRAQAPLPPVLVPPSPRESDHAGLRRNQIVAWSLFGVSGAAAVGSAIFGLAALRAEGDVERRAQPGVRYDDVVRPREDDGRLYQKYAWILAGGAVFCGGVGAALLLLDRDPERKPPPVAVNVDPAGGFVGLDYHGAF